MPQCSYVGEEIKISSMIGLGVAINSPPSMVMEALSPVVNRNFEEKEFVLETATIDRELGVAMVELNSKTIDGMIDGEVFVFTTNLLWRKNEEK